MNFDHYSMHTPAQ
jgi:hypothetical protein